MSSSDLLVCGQPVFHLTARLQKSVFEDFEVATWFWRQLRRTFPDALGCFLMPNHPHLVAPISDPDATVARMNRLLGHLAAEFRLFAPIGRASSPTHVPDRGKLRRDLRYLALNACRARLVHDPLDWWFSTHRDVVGAIVDPWVRAEDLAAVFRANARTFLARYHAYVSSDPSTDVRG